MLIKIPKHSLQGVKKDKNPFWEERNKTPNEWYQSKFPTKNEKQYQTLVNGFAKYNKIPGPHKFFEVRIVEREVSALFNIKRPWWDHPELMDRVYWVFQKPVIDNIDGKPLHYYALEPFECVRVWTAIGKPKETNALAAFIVPVDATTMAWDERVNGVSEHLRFRPEKDLTQQEIDAQERKKDEIKRILATATDISNDPQWTTNFPSQRTKK